MNNSFNSKREFLLIVKDLPEEPGKDFKQAENMYGLNKFNIKMYKKTDEEIR